MEKIDNYLSVLVHQEYCWIQIIYQFRSLHAAWKLNKGVRFIWVFAVMMRKTGMCISLSAGQNFCYGTDKVMLVSHMQSIARELKTLVFKLDHMVQTLNFLAFLEHSTTITTICQR